MIFQYTWQQVLDGTKSQTRRLVKLGCYERQVGWSVIRDTVDKQGLHSVKLWTIGHTYTVQPGRGQKAVGRIRITGIRQERVQDMTIDDMIAEGIAIYTVARGILSDNPPDKRWKFIELWDSIHTKPGTRWNENPPVWVLSFEVVQP